MKEKILPINFWNTFVTIFAFFLISLTSWYCLAFFLITPVEAAQLSSQCPFYGEITRECYLGRFYPACHSYWDILLRLNPLSPHFLC